MEKVLQTRSLGKAYGDFWALREANLQLFRGEICGIVGKNGAGKTTLFKLLTGLLRANEGEIELFGSSQELEKKRYRIGTIIEQPEFFPNLSATENLHYFRLQRGVADPSAVERTLNEVGLGDVGKKKFKAFSLGMKQRLGLALALLNNPDILILDEPVNGIDPEGIVSLRNLIRKLAQERQIAVLISSHILGELSTLATRFLILHEGRILDSITQEELAQKTNRYIEIQSDKIDRIIPVLEQELDMHSYLVEHGNRLLVFADAQFVYPLAQTLVRNDLSFSKIAASQDSLEDYFIQLIGDQKEVTHA